MPELPEVETIKNDLKKRILGKKITGVEIRSQKVINPIRDKSLNGVRNKPADFIKILKGNSFSGLDRIGKLLIFELADKKNFLLIHLKMTGQLIYCKGGEIVAGGHETGEEGNETGALPGKHTHLIFSFANRAKLFFNDLRKFGYAKIVGEEELKKIKGEYGIEPLTKGFTLAAFKKVLEGKNAPVKAVLLNQGLIAGIGNIYADEALFEARIRPSRRAGSLADKEKRALFKAINNLLKKAIKYRGTTFSNYVDAAGQKGNFTRMLKVYHREGDKCKRCGAAIKKSKVAGRGTRFCDKCQK
ncbi:MAG: bifunctional DNA-formamidopyrimidine glycosylase/DNA-(apurinic or apyrimidinic site) lyase [Patescibacteria group bacterium]|nr:bifunctional DNA-formamidopyrimidine glycosylase/DNA-(apurinic or apyrimidinic site) lyase [Patescibacteria group bacterium]MDD5294475.1 bifunctional DNA-formamidopyrimidine glycosylase/DNA-(apurinic or apyrimidinic site) lyase [Patescibacteria group bacterium]MDD5554409.1 bifunctional DNA-formamidopyrimidine glycosylase/DNA-(apurinic or apyrimidinic site) lyase [Patescibacteria group bacterium]